ncbi:MAG: tail fiber domain-containing protein [Rhodospirillales bacterium]|nr:tail fiber domain-containing protein [Rhodospirillales bacterium]
MSRIRKSGALPFLALMCSTSLTAFAQEVGPGDACLAGEAGYFVRAADDDPGPTIDGQNFMFCNGSNWIGFLRYDNPSNSVILSSPAAAPGDVLFSNSQWSLWLDEVNDEFELKGKKSDGTIISSTVGGGSGLWTDNTTHISYQSAHIIKSGQALPATMDDDGKRMFFYPDMGAFRGGRIAGGSTAWQNANIGSHSFAWGENVQASGDESVAMGKVSTATGFVSVAMGGFNTASGDFSVAMGNSNTASGYYGVAMGYGNTASGLASVAMGRNSTANVYDSVAMGYSNMASGVASVAMGNDNTASGDFSIAMGYYNTASGYAGVAMGKYNTTSGGESVAMGRSNTASGETSVAMGRYVASGSGTALDGAGDSSMAFGLQTRWHATKPKITGDRTMALFFDGDVLNANSGVNITADDSLILYGGKLGIGLTATPASALHLGAGEIRLDGGVGNQAGCIKFDDATDKLQFSHDCSAYTDFGGGSGLWTDNTTHISYEDVHIVKNGQALPAALDDNGARMFFYPDKQAFRGGLIIGGSTAWQDANIQDNSFAWGTNVQASGNSSVAMGYNNTASSSQSVAMGGENTASGYASVAMGYGSTASGYTSVAMGHGNTSSGSESVAMGYGNGASGALSVAMGYGNTASGDYSSVAMGYGNTASGDYSSVAMGFSNIASGNSSVAMGINNTADNTGAVALGVYNQANELGSIAAGFSNTANGYSSVAMGYNNTTSGETSVAMGSWVVAGSGTTGDGAGDGSMAFGLQTAWHTPLPKITGDRTVVFFFDGNTADANSGVNITADDSFIIYGGNVGIGEPNPDAALDVVGDIEFTGVIVDVSDRRLKSDIDELPDGQLDKILALNGVSFRMKDDPKQALEYGLIAQDVRMIYPALVHEGHDGMLSLNYLGLIAPMIEAIEEQNNLIKIQKDNIESLEARMLALEELVKQQQKLE